MNKSVKKKLIICLSIIALLLVADQLLKIWIKTHFPIAGEINLIGEWCRLHFVENVGIAFGYNFGDSTGKLLLTLFRLIASIAIIIVLIKLIKKDRHYTLLISISLLFAGAVGNVIDSIFYGLIFDASTLNHIATLFPPEGGYAPIFHGRVVDMFYFPLFDWTWPAWVPLVGGQHAEFFSAVFNIADAAVTTGLALLIIDQLWIAPKKRGAISEESESENKEIEAESNIDAEEK